MNFWKTTFWAAIATASRLLSQFLVAKLVAIFAGPAAFGIIGQFQSFVSMVQLGSGGIVNSGVAKYSSEYHSSPEKLEKLIHTAVKLVFIASLITGLLISVFSKPISELIFQNVQYHWLFIVFGLTLFGCTLNQIFLSVFTGLNEMRKYASMSIFGSTVSVILIGLLTYFYHIKGALIGLVLSQVCLLFLSLIYIHKIPAQVKLLTARLDPECLKKLFQFSLMAITCSISLPLAQMAIRVHVAEHSGWTDVGCWQAVLRISDAYLLIITTIIGTYALPKYARISETALLKKEILSVMIKIVPVAAIFGFCIYYLRHLVILLLFSSDFLPAESLFFFQLIGDVAKIASWVMANVLIAKAQIKTFVILELIFTVSFFILSILFFDNLGIKGLTIAFCINYIGYFFIVLIWLIYFLNRGKSL